MTPRPRPVLAGIVATLWASCAPPATSASITPAQAGHVCALVMNCAAGDPYDCTSEDVIQTATLRGIEYDAYYRGHFDCFTSVGTCDAVRTCVTLGHDAGYCATHAGRSCDADVMMDCVYGYATDCTTRGEHCVAVGAAADCATGTACSGGASPDRCDGDYLVTCDSGLSREKRYDCTTFYPGGTCGLSGSHLGCIPNGPACSSTAARCDGDVLVVCNDGREQRFDCVSDAAHCSTARSSATCVPTSTACAAGSNRCVGTTWETCIAGSFVAADCVSLGFTSCGTTSRGAACM